MFSMKYDFDMKCFNHQGTEFTFTKRPGYVSLIMGLTALFLSHLILEKNVVLAGVSVIIIFLSMLHSVRSYQKECLLILNGIGVTIKKSSLWGTSSRYFDLQYIQDIVIVEAISMQSVYFQLVLIPQKPGDDAFKQNKLFPLFKDFQPSLQHLKTVYRHVQEKLIIPREKMKERR